MRSMGLKDKLLIICGPTSTGKTSLALNLARKFDGEILSADSRQVYIGMDIGTGKDVPENSKFKIQNSKLKLKDDKYLMGFYEINLVKVWGLDIARPDQDFSVSHYVIYAKTVIADILKRGKLPVVVGGTGLYIKVIIDPPETIDIPQNKELRMNLYKRSSDVLKNLLQLENLQKWESMNNSDRNNPRRLIRAIEVAKYLKLKKADTVVPVVSGKKFENELDKHDYYTIGLAVDGEQLKQKIYNRINQRVKQGIVNELKSLQKKGYGWNLSSMQALCYRQWKDYFDKKCGMERVLDKWKKDEIDYARRQMVWLKKMKNINWFDISDKEYQAKIEESVYRWYNKKITNA
jgi:tRNA dimethylallyltransferase